MANPEDEEQRIQIDEIEGDGNNQLSSDSSDSEDGLPGAEKPSPKMEWLATSREKRSTAGNRMKSMIAAEEPDDELELLFAEDADDAGFTDVEEDGSDAQMSSSEDEEAQDHVDDLEGEKELEKQAHESRQAARKRKAQEAIPLKFRKKVKIDTSQIPSASATPAPKPRPKKKSERISWLPSPADMPTRASRRETTMAGKEQLHKQMVEREVKRLKQIEAMERKAKKMEALKKPPMTQAERLAEAALVEKKNAKSLNRWEEAEKQREEERKAKLAALNNRTLEGPVITFWSGVGEWVDGKLKHVGKIVTLEEKPSKKKRLSVVGPEQPVKSSCETDGHTGVDAAHEKETFVGPSPHTPKEANMIPDQCDDSAESREGEPPPTASDSRAPSTEIGQGTQLSHSSAVENNPTIPTAVPTTPTLPAKGVSTTLNSQEQAPAPLEDNSRLQLPQTLGTTKPSDLKPPDLQPPSTGMYTTSMFAPPIQSLMMPPELKPPSNSFLAPPAGLAQNGLSMPMIGYHASPVSANSSHILAPPISVQRQSPLSMPQTTIHPPRVPTPTRITQNISISKPKQPSTPSTHLTPTIPPPPKANPGVLKSIKPNNQKHQSKNDAPPSPPSPPANGRAARNCIILQNFNENAIKDKSVQIRILFNREMNKLSKHGPAVRCVITNHPAKYRDPKTGLPYYNSYAFREIRKLYDGEYKWSSLIGAWIGSGTTAATGVPARFMDPDAPGPSKELSPLDPSTTDSTKVESLSIDAEHQIAGDRSVQMPDVPIPQTSGNTPINTDEPANINTALAASEQSNSTQLNVLTTAATFELHGSHATTLDGPMVNAESRTIDETSKHEQVEANPPLSVAEPSSKPIDTPSIPSSTPATVVEQGVLNQ